MAPSELPYATGYANRLLADLGATLSLSDRAEPHPALRWAQCGAMRSQNNPRELRIGRAQVERLGRRAFGRVGC